MESEKKREGRFVRWKKTERGWELCEEWKIWMDHAAPAPSLTNPEEFFYEKYCALADRTVTVPVTVLIAFDRNDEDLLGFRSAICGVFRASVYGRMSVMIDGCVTPTDVGRVREGIHRAFCDLERDGREFNGYIERGLLIERPILLLSPRTVEGMDFVCLDREQWESVEGNGTAWLRTTYLSLI